MGGECSSLDPVSAMLPLWRPQPSRFSNQNDDDDDDDDDSVNNTEKKETPSYFIETCSASSAISETM